METNIAKMKCKSSSQTIPDDKRKNLKFLIPAIATKSFKTLNSMAEEKSCLRRCVTTIKKREHMDVENAIGLVNNGYSRRETRPAIQIDDKSLSKQFTRIDKSACAAMEQKDHESCLVPMPLAAYDSRDELLPGRIVEDRQVIKEEMMDIFNHEAAQDEESSEEKKKMKISRKTLKAKKAELKQLKQETTMFSQELQRISTMCMHLVDDNTLLMDELKKICDPRVIEMLEAKDPAGTDPQTD